MKNQTTGVFMDTLSDPVTDYVRHVFQLTNYVILCGIISFFGIGANITNIIVFVKQGFKDSINISLLGLAVSDLACLVTMFWMICCFNFVLFKVDLPFAPMDVMYLTGGWVHVCFNRVTSFITAFITLERCLCITMPLKVKSIITRFKTKIIIIFVYMCTVTLFTPFYFVNTLHWVYSVSTNRTMLCLTFTKHRETVESVSSLLHSVFLSTALLLSVIVCTIILVVKLNKKSKWREQTIAQKTSQPEPVSVKEKKVVKMIILISTIFIICYFPATVTFLVMIFFPAFTIGNRYENMLYTVWSLLFVLDVLNSSLNMLVYFNMSTKYRATLQEMCRFYRKGVQI